LQIFEKFLALIHELSHDLQKGRVPVFHFMDSAVIERQNLRVRVAEDEVLVCGDDELGILKVLEHVMNQDEETQLALWRKRGLGLIEQKESITPKSAV
jgi:hypothetical protein